MCSCFVFLQSEGDADIKAGEEYIKTSLIDEKEGNRKIEREQERVYLTRKSKTNAKHEVKREKR